MDVLSQELEESKREAFRLENEIKKNSIRGSHKKNPTLNYIARKIIESRNPEISSRSAQENTGYIFSEIKNSLHPDAIDELNSFGYLNENGGLTKEGVSQINMLERLYS